MSVVTHTHFVLTSVHLNDNGDKDACVSDDFAEIARRHPNDVYSSSPDEVAAMQLAGVKQRFEQLRPGLRVLDSVATDLGLTAIDSLEDVASLCFPHTMYKSYSANYIEKGRYDRLTQWLDGFTVQDLSGIDVTGCDSLESWLDSVEAASSLFLTVSSGTTGKVSFFPRSTVEAETFVNFVIQSFKGFGVEPDSGLHTGAPEWFSPIPMASGRQNLPRMFDLIRRHCYGGDGSRIHCLGDGHWDADMLWLWGRMRQADARGETAKLELTPALERVRTKVVQATRQAPANTDRFLEELVEEYRGKQVIIFSPQGSLIDLANTCRTRGLKPDFADGSFIVVGGGNKGQAFPSGWEESLYSVFPAPHQQVYGMTEATALNRMCSAGWFHWPPTVATLLLDPGSSELLPRTGVQTGRLALFDLCAETHWGGAITGDRVTIDWNGECPCGRRGPRVHSDITRYSDLRDDDKITCAKSPGAYERATDALLSL